MSDSLLVNEIYLSLQGESTFAGLPCVFVRLTACNLRCSYCDTAYSFTEGKKMSVAEAQWQVLEQARPFAKNHGVAEPTRLTAPFLNRQSATGNTVESPEVG